MKKNILIILITILLPVAAFSQEVLITPDETENTVNFQTLINQIMMDSGVNGNNITINQSGSLFMAMERQLSLNPERSVIGYRIRIFLDNKQTARAASEKVENDFTAQYPNIKVYRSYNSPYWRVTVGNFRTKSEASKYLSQFRKNYPSVFLVREGINTMENVML